MEKVIISGSGDGVFCTLWIIGWLFTIGYLQLSFGRGFLALFVWPYFMGKKFKKQAVVV